MRGRRAFQVDVVMPPSLTLYELTGADDDLRFSPHCWKIRMALLHKGLEADRRPWRFTEKDAIAFSGGATVPVLVDGDKTVTDSWRIALHLEEHHADRPSLFGSETGRSYARFVNSYADTVLVAPLRHLLTLDILARVHEKDRDYFRASREKRFGQPLETHAGDPAVHIPAFRAALTPVRTVVAEQPFLSGAAPAYADYCAFGALMWARCVSPLRLLEKDDPVYGWRERMLDAFGGHARAAACTEQDA
ncbi:glutathione S-transferase [Azorhizobium sp. AG788]|nr:glutathione S-transferase [Azorhizobium sp. AG788]